MSEKEIKEFLEILDDYKRKFAENQNLAREFFTRAGLLTKKGNLRKPYRNLCTVFGRVSS